MYKHVQADVQECNNTRMQKSKGVKLGNTGGCRGVHSSSSSGLGGISTSLTVISTHQPPPSTKRQIPSNSSGSTGSISITRSVLIWIPLRTVSELCREEWRPGVGTRADFARSWIVAS